MTFAAARFATGSADLQGVRSAENTIAVDANPVNTGGHPGWLFLL